MELVIHGEPKEIAALVLAVQERQAGTIRIDGTAPHTKEDRDTLAAVIAGFLRVPEESPAQPPETTERTQNQAAEPHLEEPPP